ncbi:helix-turn-helix domain-containing protein [Paenibacillus roseipurpureus]|uniref:Helix-turn-helix domain-containing protein n=1 Tax=Paenibacillus roseopurpureus TaxID=2918901 RepID=A0AA96RJ69_9BACL|nr:helix-turn-helix domain-containing protein [Paenibacillus sp. MBLB1832]WNR42979.1 helix-turn-helix domain-containing protein [Paenibacillus sp. MBLB1832]
MNNNASMKEQFGLSIVNIVRSSYTRLKIRDIKKNQWVLSHVVKGQLTMETGGISYNVRAGQVMVHPPHIEFSEYNPSSGIHQVLFLDVTLSEHLDLFRMYPIPPVITLVDEASFTRCFQELNSYWNQPDKAFRNVYIGAGILELIKLLLNSWESDGFPSRPEQLNSTEDRFMEVIQYMQTHLRRKISREELSSLLHLHPNYFDKLFYKHFHQTPMHMLRMLRLRKAQSLLETSDITLEQIAGECGLVDAAYFAKWFKKQCRETPGQYRTRMKISKRMY